MRVIVLGVSAAVLAGCMEPQPAPEIAERPSTDFSVTELAGGLDAPWSVAPLPGGGALVTEKAGRLLRVDGGALSEIGPLPGDLYYTEVANSQAGLFDIVLGEDFEETGRVWLSYAYGTAEANGTALATARLVGDRLEGLETVFRADSKDTNAHYGAKVVALGDGTIAMSTGDGFVYREAAQDMASTLGKIVRVRVDGAPAGSAAGSAVWSLGHRNVQGLAVDRATGVLWEHEHGPRGGDELNRIEPGANYGWPVVTTGVDYNGMRISPFETADGFEPYVHQWTPSVAPSGLAIYRGELFPDWQGDALVGALAGKSLRRVDLEDGVAVGEEKLLGDLGARIRDVREAPDGSVWVLTNEESSRLLRVAP